MVSFSSALRSFFAIATMAGALFFSAAAQQTHALEPAPVVKFIYFVPSNVAFNHTSYAAMQSIAADFAQWNRRYFDGRAPNYKVDYVLGDHTWEWYVYNREEDNRIAPWNMKEHRYHIAADLSHTEIKRKLGDPKKDKNLKHVIFLHEHASSEDTSECASEGEGMAWMSYEYILLARTEPTKSVLVMAHEVGHMWGLDDTGDYYGDCMRLGFNNDNKTCDFCPSNKAKVLKKYGNFFTTTHQEPDMRPAPPVCMAKIGDKCTGSNGVRSCCPPEGYCQPVSSTEYECMKRPLMCSDQLTDIDYYGNDLKAVMNVATPEDCCNLCSNEAGCRAYTYLFAGAPGINPGSCYLKKLAGEPTRSIGAVSGVILEDWSTGPCTAKKGDLCMKNSVNIRGCCPTGTYCMPWSPTEYRCEEIPKQCGVQRMDTNYNGFDIQLAFTLSPDQCCEVCSQTDGCKAYTYYASAINNTAKAGSCFLKSSDQQVTFWLAGAISGAAIIPKDCENKLGDSCVMNPCCPSGAYCQPVGEGAAQCMKKPVQCPVQKPNVDYYGDDLPFVKVTSSEQCCEACSLNKECNAYSYYQYTVPGREAGNCYLKKAVSDKTAPVIGAVSALLTTRLGCQAEIGGACGYDSCCPSDGFCQPLAGGKNQCVKKPAQCAVQVLNVDYVGYDIKTETVKSAEQCCDACSQHPDCNAYTYYNFTTEGRGTGACYLKKSTAGGTSSVVGAVSGSMVTRSACQGKIGGACGFDSCCPDGGYCQPLAGGANQCLAKPAMCGIQLPNVEYSGTAISTLTAVASADKCCDACSQNPKCNAYSYYLFATGNRKAGTCYLKSTAGGTTTTSIGAVSGSKIERPTGCQGVIGGACGYDSCCPDGGFCQPLAGGKNQCVKKPAQCAAQVLNVDYVGNDIKMVKSKSADLCCDACSANADCNAYSFYLFSTEGRDAGACYLKTAAGYTSPVEGAVSGSVVSRRDCKGKINEACGVGSCCPSDAYCQPLTSRTNKCLKKPAQCGVHVANLDIIGNDVGMLSATSAAKCCEACSRNAKCNAYSYYLFAAGGRPAGACYLKSAVGDTTPVVGAVSGSMISRS